MTNYLRLMGIDVWHFRTSLAFKYYRYDLLDSQSRQVGVLLADAVLLNEAEFQLVEKIVKATKKQFRGGLRKDPWEPGVFVKCVILLGSRVSNLINAEGIHIIRSYSLEDLLKNTELKVKTWRDLKTALKLMRE